MQSNINWATLDFELDREYFKVSPDGNFASRHESPEHLLGKEYLRNLINNEWIQQGIKDVAIEVEYPIKIAGKDKRYPAIIPAIIITQSQIKASSDRAYDPKYQKMFQN